jgi:hypothetical protein
MGYCAKVDENNIVTDVIVIDDFPEPQLQEYIKDVLQLEGRWVKASEDPSFRYNYPSPGYYWDETAEPNGAFIAPKIDESLILDKTTYKWKYPE